MPSSNLQTVQRIIDAINRGDADAVVELVAPEFELDYSRSLNPDLQGVHHGREPIRGFVQAFLEPWGDDYRAELEYTEVGDNVISVGDFRARGSESGAEVVARGAQLWEFEGAGTLPVAMRQYQTEQEAVEAAAG